MRAWLDQYLIDGWTQAHKFWSVRLCGVWAVISIAWMALPAFQFMLPPMGFAALTFVLAVLVVVGRYTHQPGLTI